MRNKAGTVINCIFIAVVIAAIVIMSFIFRDDGTESVQRYDLTVLEADREISALYARDGLVYVGTDKGVIIYDADNFAPVDRIEDLSLIYSAGIAGTDDGSIFIGHEKGLTRIGPDGTRTDYMAPDIPKGRVNTVVYDGEYIWCGTYNGAARLKRTTGGDWAADKVMTADDGLKCDSVNVILPLGDDLLIGSYLDNRNGGLTLLYSDGRTEYIGKEQGLPHPYVTSAALTAGDEVLVGCGYMSDGGLAVLKKSGDSYMIRSTYYKDDGLPGEKVRAVFTGGNIAIITTESDGVVAIKLNSGAFLEPEFSSGIYINEENGLSSNEVKCIIKAGNNYWLGTKYGLTLVPAEYIER
ncbi:MAG: hypothetical protein K6E68_04720 [Lachnospiraceae bacterium]|nr:hypothetical protein [Lachnospiraceae bacterium]